MARGKKTGGRRPGSLNRKTLAMKQAIGAGLGLLDYLLSVMRDVLGGARPSGARAASSSRCLVDTGN